MSAKPRQLAGLNFGHPPETLRFWKRLVREALRLSGGTPLYVCSAQPVAERIAELDAAFTEAGFRDALRAPNASLPSVRHWLSCKTQPIRPLLRWWNEQGRDIEVVSEFELRAALTEGFHPTRILVNGPAKHHWLPKLPLRGLSVNFDSSAELKALLLMAKRLGWRTGIRLCTSEEFDPENPAHPTQFGFTADAAVPVLRTMQRAGLAPQIIHFHLRTNVASPAIYERAILQVADVCRTARFSPSFLDIGGGLPPRATAGFDGRAFDSGWRNGGLHDWAKRLQRACQMFPELRELWLENGRFISASSGVLAITVLDVKARRGLRQLICDGGRTMNALVSNWEQHALVPLPNRSGPRVRTAVHGPTCMAFDRLALRTLPRSIRAGDQLLWLEAGAYHIPWETRFSHGHATVVWHDERGLRVARERQDFEDWWSQWG